MPHIAISVDMLDTGIDVPEVANLVFFKPVYSKIKFWQMIGRGTRLCPDLFGPDEDKQDFRVFDFCFNFDFFKENPKGIEADDLESRMFDLTALKMQLALAEGDIGVFESHRKRVVEIAMLLEEKSTIPAVKAQLAYLAAMQESSFWEGIDLNGLEELRLRLRGLVPFLDKKKRKIVYTDFQDEVMGVRDEPVIDMPKMTGAQYEKKVKDFLRNHLDHIVIRRLRTNQPLTATDLHGLEATLAQIGEEEGESLLSGLLERNGSPSLAYFVRSLVGMDRNAAQTAFSKFLQDRSLTPPQIRFIEMVIDQLTARGVMEASALYEAPFSNLHGDGPEALFAGKENVINGIFETLEAVQPATQASSVG